MRLSPSELAKLPKTRSDAEMQGVPYYFTGQPCKHGHVAARYLCNTGCLECVNKTLKRVQIRGIAQLTFPVVGGIATRKLIGADPTLLDKLRTILLNDEKLIDWLVRRAVLGENGTQPTALRFAVGPVAYSLDQLEPTAKCNGQDLAQFLHEGWSVQQLQEHGYAQPREAVETVT